MRSRPALECERLEPRDLPDAYSGAATLAVSSAERAAPDHFAESPERPLLDPRDLATRAQATLTAGPERTLTPSAVRAFFADASASPEEAWAFFQNYARKAIRREERMRGPLSDHKDIIQQIYVEWWEEVGTAEDMHASLLDKDSAGRQLFGKTVRRVLDRSRYDDIKRKNIAPVTEEDAPARSAEQQWVDLQIDWAQGVGNLTPQERQVLDFRREGRTFEEIGEQLGLAKQRVFEVYTEVIERLSELYRE